MEVPTATSLKDIYPDDNVAHQKERWEELLAHFKSRFGGQAEFVSRSPGRVNIIGEHIDYSLYEVLPMAVTADLLLAVSVKSESGNVIRIANTDHKSHEMREFDIPLDNEVEIDSSQHEWSNYFKCGLRAATQLLAKKRKDEKFRSVGMDIMVDGTVPSGGGLSSSAAFVCASALAVLKANGEEKVEKKELTELAITSERAVGVNSGGMDQSASVFPVRGSAIYVSFKPSLSTKPVVFPLTNPEMSFVIAQSFVTSNKQVTGPIHYNLRVMECTLAAAVLHRIFGLKKPLPKDAGPLGISLRGFHDTYFESKDGVEDNTKSSKEDFSRQLEALIELTQDYLPQEQGYSREEIADILGISTSELEQKFFTGLPVRADRFLIRQRALHVFSEALRVIKFQSLLTEASSSGATAGADLLKSLGGLMNETQDSCRDFYECSCPEIDELCKLARSAGAYGSRLTGAGWGGCSVHLVPKDKVEAVKQKWEKEYYRKKFPDITEAKLADAVVVSEPGSGSAVFVVKGDKVD